jgi:regulatory LuxR family protein
MQVLSLVAEGATNAQIAQQLVVTEETVKSHVKRILHKLGVGNRTEAAYHYLERPSEPSDELQQLRQADGQQPAGVETLPAATELKATIVKRLGERAVLRLEDGRLVEAPVMDRLITEAEVDSPALVYLDGRRRVIAWYLPKAERGVDMRGWAG